MGVFQEGEGHLCDNIKCNESITYRRQTQQVPQISALSGSKGQQTPLPALRAINLWLAGQGHVVPGSAKQWSPYTLALQALNS